jgi:hypothetical protein
LLILGVLSGCDTSYVSGRVLDFSGQPLPGAAIAVDNQIAYTITSAHGGYRVKASPNPHVVWFFKSGYTVGSLAITPQKFGITSATDVQLWRLPEATGVFVLENYQYLPLTMVEPRQYYTKERGIFNGILATPLFSTNNAHPRLIAYKKPFYDLSLRRLDPVKAFLNEKATQDTPQNVWQPVDSVAITHVPIDEHDNLLMEITFASDLPPGVYAVHWGILEGYSNTDSHAYLFEILPKDAPAPQPQTPPEPKKDTQKTTEKPAPNPSDSLAPNETEPTW